MHENLENNFTRWAFSKWWIPISSLQYIQYCYVIPLRLPCCYSCPLYPGFLFINSLFFWWAYNCTTKGRQACRNHRMQMECKLHNICGESTLWKDSWYTNPTLDFGKQDHGWSLTFGHCTVVACRLTFLVEICITVGLLQRVVKNKVRAICFALPLISCEVDLQWYFKGYCMILYTCK